MKKQRKGKKSAAQQAQRRRAKAQRQERHRDLRYRKGPREGGGYSRGWTP